MPALPIGIDLASLNLPFKKALCTAAELGADAVAIDARSEINPRDLSQTGLRQIAKLLGDFRLRVSAVRFQTRRGYDTEADLDRRIGATKAAMQFAHALGAPVLVNQVGRIPSDRDSNAWRLLVDVLDDLGRHGHRVGTLLAAETGSEGGEAFASFLAALPERTIGVDLNPGNLVAEGHSPLETIAHLGPSIVHVEATDAVADRAPGRSGLVALGEGDADFPSLLGALEQHAYQGDFTITSAGPAISVEAMGRAVEFLRAF